MTRVRRAAFTWLDGHVEAVDVYAVHDGLAFVSWPESRRIVTVKGRSVEVVRPDGCVDAARVSEVTP